MATCQSCGRDGETVTKVQRMYLADSGPEHAGDRREPHQLDPASPPVAGEIELWCASCCGTFPHVVVEVD
ncbi:MAG: hypothetical protein M9942_07640 [Microthrixaceae bacterium]|nr:hypothetical protein [Microthrixaceae bacterium]